MKLSLICVLLQIAMLFVQVIGTIAYCNLSSSYVKMGKFIYCINYVSLRGNAVLCGVGLVALICGQ
jgi:hypothetical protein